MQSDPPPARRPRVALLATGGTIAGAQPSQRRYGYQPAAFDLDQLLAAVPQVTELAELRGEQVMNIGSQDMDDAAWLALGRRVAAAVAGDAESVVITHGTDTMEETAFFLQLVVRTDKPIVMVGSMRPATAISPDGPANLYNAVAVAVDPRARGRGVLVVFNESIEAARRVAKTSTSNVDTFRSTRHGPAGLVHTGQVTWFEVPDGRRGRDSEFSIDGVTVLPRVDVLYAHAGMRVDLIDAAIANGAQGLVIAGVGNGNMTRPALERLAAAAAQGIVVVRSTRLANGMTWRNGEIDDDANGFVASLLHNPAKSRVLLQQALRVTRDPREIQRMFEQY